MDETHRKKLGEIFMCYNTSQIVRALAVEHRVNAIKPDKNEDVLAAEILELAAYRLESINQ